MAEVRTEEGRLYLLAAIDRTSKFAYVELHEKVTTGIAGDFLRALIQAVPYRVHTVLTDHGIHFATPSNTASAAPLIRKALARGKTVWAHAFEFACAQNKIDHRLTKPRHPWTNGQVERMNRTLKDATVRRHYCEGHDQLRQHLGACYSGSSSRHSRSNAMSWARKSRIAISICFFSAPLSSSCIHCS
jgi:transposase InsO family protein